MILADKIIQLRKKSGWSQEELAQQLNVTRQSVSKWEGGQSVPDLERVLQMSRLFGVSTDYLLKDELEEVQTSALTEPEPEEWEVRRVSMEEANAFLAVEDSVTMPTAWAVFLCILSPVCLILLGAGAEMGYLPISEDMAAGLGVIILLLMVAAAVAVFISCGVKTNPYEYLEKEEFETEYGVTGMVRRRKEQFREHYTRGCIAGTVLCILSPVPLMVGAALSWDNFLLMSAVCLLLLTVGLAVVCFIRVCTPWESMEKLLQEGDYSRLAKRRNSRYGWIIPVYWLVVTALFLGLGFYTENWKELGFIWPIAGVLFAVLVIALDSFTKQKEGNGRL